jgi:hypothetical protein
LWRVLRDDATWWLNFGDSYSRTTLNHGKGGNLENKALAPKDGYAKTTKVPMDLKPKDLIGIPWRIAFALQADGWWLRNEIIWAKGVSFLPDYAGSCMPESVKDRCTRSHEQVFLFSKSKRYYFDHIAVREQAIGGTPGNVTHKGKTAYENGDEHMRTKVGLTEMGPSVSRNLRTVWVINPGNFKGSHFATFPEQLVEPMIKSGSSEYGACPECGAAWERVVKKPDMSERPRRADTSKGIQNAAFQGATSSGQAYQNWRNANPDVTLGFRPSCSCSSLPLISDPPKKPKRKKGESDQSWQDRLEEWGCQRIVWRTQWLSLKPQYAALPITPCEVLDFFAGSGTTALVALKLNRRASLVELSQPYIDEHIVRRLSAETDGGIQITLPGTPMPIRNTHKPKTKKPKAQASTEQLPLPLEV